MGSGASLMVIQNQVTHLNISNSLIANVRDDCLALSDKGLPDEEIQNMLKTSYTNIIDNSDNIIESLFAEISVGRLKDVESRRTCRLSCIKLFEKGLHEDEVLILLKIQFKNLADCRYNTIERIQTEVKCRQECIRLFEQGVGEVEIQNILKQKYKDIIGDPELISDVFIEIQNLKMKRNVVTAIDEDSDRQASKQHTRSGVTLTQGTNGLDDSTDSRDSNSGNVRQATNFLERQTSILRPILVKALSIIRPIEQFQKLPARKNQFADIAAKVDTKGIVTAEMTPKKRTSKVRRGSLTPDSSFKLNTLLPSNTTVKLNSGSGKETAPRRRRNSMDDSVSRPKKIYEEDENITYFKGSFLNSQQGPLG